MSRYILFTLILVGLAVVGLALVRADAQPSDDTRLKQEGESCVTVCLLHTEGDGSASARPHAGHRASALALDPSFQMPAHAVPLDRYLPVSLLQAAQAAPDPVP